MAWFEIMRWYVSNQGNTVGPISADQLKEGIADGKITRGMHVRDESGSWMGVEQSPFAGLLPTEKPATTPGQQAAGCAIVSVLCALLAWGSCSVLGNNEPTAEEIAENQSRERRNRLIEAWSMCQVFAKKQLKSPGTADFGGVFDGDYQDPSSTTRKLSENTFQCTGWVDSQNTFGAVVRTEFSMTVRDNAPKDTWSLVELHYMQ